MRESEKLSSKLAGLLLAFGSAAALLVIGVLMATTARSFLEIERNTVRAGLGRVEAAVDRQLDVLVSNLADYAVWDDTYAFVQGSEENYVKDNMGPAVLKNLGISFAAVYDEKGRRIAAEAGAGKTLPDGIPAKLGASPLFAERQLDERVKGLQRIGDRFYEVAAMAAVKSDGSGPAKGLMVYGRELDADVTQLIGKLTGLSVAFKTLQANGEKAAPEIATDGLNKPIVGTRALKDLEGKPLIAVVTTEPRTVFQQGHRALIMVVIAAVIAFLAAFLAFKTAFNALLLAPLERLEACIAADHSIDIAFDEQLRALSGRPDAVGRTARLIAEARGEMRKHWDLQRTANERLETEVRARTSELTRANRELAIYQRVMSETSEGIVITDIDGNIVETNKAFCAMTGYSADELEFRNPRILKSDRHDDAFFRAMWEAILSKGRWEGEIWNKKKDGAVFPAWLSIDTIADENGKPVRFVGVSADISRVKEAEESLNRMAFYDSLTDLPNRALFKDRFRQALSRAQRAGTRVALVYLDLDRFKNINDSLGHAAGDALLKEAAKRLKAQVRDADTVCRLGGDEFTIILESIGSSGDAAAVGRKILSAMRESFTIEESEVFVGTSIGIALFPYDGTDADELIKRADAAMYEAKEHGRGQIRFASGESGAMSLRRLETETKLRKGIDRGEFFLNFQPQVATGGAAFNSADGIIGAEALLRWKPTGEKVVPPDAFIDVAEESGLIVPMGAFILKEACAEARRWRDLGIPLQISVNVSQLQFERGRIIEQVNDALYATGLEPKFLKLEITESLFSRDMDGMIAVMKDLRGIGVSFAVDDFGTGYSSLKYIDRLPIDSLKIDKSFIDRIDSPYEGGEIATAVVALARSFGLESIAEGVETASQLDALKARGCDAIQGYFVSRPLDADDFRSFIRAKDLLAELSAPT